uniref:Helicase ATP-binding domain-containing protein n=1 Tax=viral metagenome TaxID=1070528 RepID=A0A6C0DYV3_9ZZZZ
MSNIDELIKSCMKEIKNIYDKIDDGYENTDILEEYEDITMKMLKFIKTKDITYFKFWFNVIKLQINSSTAKEKIYDLFSNDPNNNKEITKFYVEKIYDNLKIEDDLYDLKIYINKKEDTNIKSNFELNASQKQVKKYFEDNEIQNGIICHATGTGKTICQFIIMGSVFENENKVIFLLCNFKNIIHQTFYSDDNKINYNLFRILKKEQIFNIWDCDIYDVSSDEKRVEIINSIKKIKDTTQNKIFLINTQYINNEKCRYKQLPVPNLILFDECHNITGEKTYEMLEYFSKKDTKIIGLSATPIRNIKSAKNYDKLRNIFPDDNNDINILSNYDNIKAITNGDILNIEIFLFSTKIKNDNKYSDENINSCIDCIIKVLSKMFYKKMILWCGTIKHTTRMYEELKKKVPTKIKEIKKENIYMDHSQTDDEGKDYLEFKNIKNGIIVCANKYREGSDIKYLGACVLADFVLEKSQCVFIQCIGRVQRKEEKDYPEKKISYVIDHYDISDDKQITIKGIVKKLIGYYTDFYNHTTLKQTDRDLLDEYNKIMRTYEFKKKDKIIVLQLNNKLKININIDDVDISMSDTETEVKIELEEKFKKENNLTDDKLLSIEYKAFTKNNKEYYNIESKEEYMEYIKTKKLEPNPETKYKSIWKGWNDYLGIEKQKYINTSKEVKYICKKYNITKSNYETKAKEHNLPPTLEEFKSVYGKNFDIFIFFN